MATKDISVRRSRRAARSREIIRAGAAIMILVFTAAGCSQSAENREAHFGADPITVESLEGLILEGEGPIPARLIYQSKNSLSTEEEWMVLEVIAQELDRLVELAGRLDQAVNDETAQTDYLIPGEPGAYR